VPITDSVLCRSRLLPRPPQFVPSTGPTNYREISGPEISFQSMQRTKNILRSGRSHILHSWPNGVLEETKWFLLFRYVIEQWALTVIKFLRFFCINICYFSTRFYFFVPQWHSHPSFIKIVHVFDYYTPIKPERSVCGYTTIRPIPSDF